MTADNDSFDSLNTALDISSCVDSFYGLKSYFFGVYEFLPYANEQRKVRISARIKKSTDPVEIGEYLSEIEELERQSEKTLPHFAWGGFLVTVFSAYEVAISSLFQKLFEDNYVAVSFANYERASKKSFIDRAVEYSERVISVQLLGAFEIDTLKHLNSLRNSYVHAASQFSKLRKETREGVRNQINKGLSLQFEENGKWLANPQSSWYFYSVVEQAMHEYIKEVLRKYVWRT